MSALRNSNFKRIRSAFFEDLEGPEKAVRRFKKSTRAGLGVLLRHHSEEEIGERETYWREEFDLLLSYYSMMEVAVVCGMVPRRLPQRHTQFGRRLLDRDSVRTYYEFNYPLPLVEAHRRRLAGKPVMSWGCCNSPATYSAFFELSLAIDREEGPLETFLWFLDDGTRNGYCITDTIRALTYPNKFLKAMASEDEDDVLAMSIQGFVEFLYFCLAFDRLLTSVKKLPLLQSVMWHHHGHWFGRLSHEVGRHVRTAIQCMVHWTSKSDTNRSLRHSAFASPEQCEAAVLRLCFGSYGWPLHKALNAKILT